MDEVVARRSMLEIRLRDGRICLISTDRIRRITSRLEGGTALELGDGEHLLVSTPLEEVAEALEAAREGDTDAA